MPSQAETPAGLPHPPAPAALEVALGCSMPTALGQVPVLDAEALEPADPALVDRRHSMLARDLLFTGKVRLAGTLTVSGRLRGEVDRLCPEPGSAPGSTHITVTESGQVEGRMRADDIAVLGLASGLLDASGGRITLHQTAQVSGHLRYARLQVNGALLDARLERVDAPCDGPGPAAARQPESPSLR